MNKKTLFIFTLFSLFVWVLKPNAETCTTAELARLKKEAAKVKLTYIEEEEEIELTPEMIADGASKPLLNPYFNMKLANVTPELEVYITNDYNDDGEMVYGSSVNGLYEFRWDEVYDIVKFTYKVSASSTSSCPQEELSIGYLVTPKYNTFADMVMCEGISDYKYCSKFVTFEMNYLDQEKKIKDYIAEKKAKESESKENIFDKISEFINEHKTLVIGGAMAVAAVGVTYVIMVKRRKRVK